MSEIADDNAPVKAFAQLRLAPYEVQHLYALRAWRKRPGRVVIVLVFENGRPILTSVADKPEAPGVN